MGFFDSLFGGGKSAEPPKKTKKPKAAPVAETTQDIPSITVEGEIDPKIVAAITASINTMMDDAEMIAAIVAATVHARSVGAFAVRIKRPNNAWAASGRQKIMDSRQFA